MSLIQRSKDNESIYTPEVRKRMSDAHIGKPQDPELVAKRVKSILKTKNQI